MSAAGVRVIRQRWRTPYEQGSASGHRRDLLNGRHIAGERGAAQAPHLPGIEWAGGMHGWRGSPMSRVPRLLGEFGKAEEAARVQQRMGADERLDLRLHVRIERIVGGAPMGEVVTAAACRKGAPTAARIWAASAGTNCWSASIGGQA